MASLRSNSFGMITLSIYLILVGLSRIIDLSFNGFGLILGILAIVAGVLILIGK